MELNDLVRVPLSFFNRVQHQGFPPGLSWDALRNPHWGVLLTPGPFAAGPRRNSFAGGQEFTSIPIEKGARTDLWSCSDKHDNGCTECATPKEQGQIPSLCQRHPRSVSLCGLRRTGWSGAGQRLAQRLWARCCWICKALWSRIVRRDVGAILLDVCVPVTSSRRP